TNSTLQRRFSQEPTCVWFTNWCPNKISRGQEVWHYGRGCSGTTKRATHLAIGRYVIANDGKFQKIQELT
ncbi:MAG: hypothetical protein CSA33_04085, partial [Desulfobulbus propionicus]